MVGVLLCPAGPFVVLIVIGATFSGSYLESYQKSARFMAIFVRRFALTFKVYPFKLAGVTYMLFFVTLPYNF